jgi:hypothetical protein
VADDVMHRSADAHASSSSPVSPQVRAHPESRADRARRLVYRGRFALLYLLLAMAAGAAIGAFVVLVERDSPAPAPPWSEFEPVGSAERRAAQIGDRVSDPYRLPSGDPLAPVTYAGPPTIAGPDGSPLQVRAIAVQSEATASTVEDVNTHAAASSIQFLLCGLGPACSISEGQPTVERLALLRREALELALYSFKYIEGVETVLVLLPATQPDGQGALAVFLERDDLKAALEQPLSKTLPAPFVPGIGEMAAGEKQTVDRLTRSHLFAARPLQAQDGSFVMVLVPALS